MQGESVDKLRMTAIQAFGQPEDRGERTHRLPAASAEFCEAGMAQFWRGATMVPRDERDRLDLFRLEAAEIAVLDQIVRVLVMAFVTDMDTDVVDERRVLQPFALAVRQAVDGACLVEERQGQSGHLGGMFRPVVAALGELDDTAAPHVGITVGLNDLLTVARDVVEHQTFTQRQITQRELARTQTSEDGIEQNGAGHGEIRPPGLEAGNTQASFEIERDERLPDAPELFR